MTDEMFPPRDYQIATLDAFEQTWAKGESNRLAAVLPTGAGKTVVFSHQAARRIRDHGTRSLIIAHREELITQAAGKIRAIAPDLNVGIVKAERDEHQDADVIVASVQTLAVEKRRNRITGIGHIIVDEAHHAAAPTYMQVLNHFGAFNGLPVAGVTATLTRQDGGLDEVWQEVVYQCDILDLVDAGHLVDVKGKTVTVAGLRLDEVHSRGGDFQDGELGQAIVESGAAEIVAAAYAEHAGDRPGIVFCPTVAAAETMAAAMTAAGIPTGLVWGGMSRDERAETLDAYQDGELQALANCQVLTEGYDAPWASCVVIARPTRSPGLYVQMVGRVLRTWHGKTDALVLDVVGAATRHKLASLVDLTGRRIPGMNEDETLAEAAARAAQDDGIKLPTAAVGWVDVDLFAGSASRWLRTYGGTFFVPIDNGQYFLIHGAEPGTWRIRKWARDEGGFRTPKPDNEYPLEYAMRRADQLARARSARLSGKSAGWRGRPASDKQIAKCRAIRLPIPNGSTAGDVSDLIAVADASRLIDPWVTANRLAPTRTLAA